MPENIMRQQISSRMALVLQYDRLDVFWQLIVGTLTAALQQAAKLTVRQIVGAKTYVDASRRDLSADSMKWL